jgi:hypothetical protein
MPNHASYVDTNVDAARLEACATRQAASCDLYQQIVSIRAAL